MAGAITNAIRIAKKAGFEIEVYEYDVRDGKIDGVSVAEKVGKNPETVYKTLVTQGQSKECYVFVIPVAEELDLKKCAAAVGEKNIAMIHVKDINKLTGYIRGGCSPIGMKKQYKTVLDSSSKKLSKITVSAGKIGLQIELKTDDLVSLVNADVCDVIRTNN